MQTEQYLANDDDNKTDNNSNKNNINIGKKRSNTESYTENDDFDANNNTNTDTKARRRVIFKQPSKKKNIPSKKYKEMYSTTDHRHYILISESPNNISLPENSSNNQSNLMLNTNKNKKTNSDITINTHILNDNHNHNISQPQQQQQYEHDDQTGDNNNMNDLLNAIDNNMDDDNNINDSPGNGLDIEFNTDDNVSFIEPVNKRARIEGIARGRDKYTRKNNERNMNSGYCMYRDPHTIAKSVAGVVDPHGCKPLTLMVKNSEFVQTSAMMDS